MPSAPALEWVPENHNGAIKNTVARRTRFLLLKRVFDICISLVVIVLVLSWLIPLFWLLIRIDSKGGVFFVQKRIGKDDRPFYCIKFRTMVRNSVADELPAVPGDERITRVGRFLRRTSLDELPQFLNVLCGQMSIVGPRPHMPVDCIRFSFIITSYSFRHLVRPGITGWAQVNGYHGPSPCYESVMLRYYWDAMYVRKANPALDARILVVTFVKGVVNMFGRSLV
jgi:putative colanic acid biosynthesis UDP-glucose lipid carrier transferase